MPKDSRVKVDISPEIKTSLQRLSIKTKNSEASLVREAIMDLLEKYKSRGMIE